MIVSALLSILTALLTQLGVLLSSLGTVSENTDIVAAIAYASGLYASMNVFFPMDTLLAIIAIDVGIETIIFTYKLIRWAYQKIPFVN